MVDVYLDWADALKDSTLGAINFGIESCKSDPHPPNQGEFVAKCRQYDPGKGVLRLENIITKEQMQANRKRIKMMSEILGLHNK